MFPCADLGKQRRVRILRLPGVFKPHSDSRLLASHVMKERLPREAKVLDLCTGSGVLAVAAATTGFAEVVAVDISRRSTITAAANAWLNGVRITTLRGDLFEAVGDRRFDLIVSNPPYLPGRVPPVGRHSAARAWESGVSGRRLLDRICAQAPAHLNPGGVLLLVHSSVCGERKTIETLGAAGLPARVVDRRPGPLGPLLRGRTEQLRERGLLKANGLEDLLVIRAQAPDGARAVAVTLPG